MKPVHQEPNDGLCQAACVASMFHLPLGDVAPHLRCPTSWLNDETKETECSNPDHWLTREKDAGHAPGEGPGYWHCGKSDFQKDLYDKWAAKRGLSFTEVTIGPWSEPLRPRQVGLPPGLCIAYGPAARGYQHAVVWDTRETDAERPFGRMVHDPHPSGAGLEKLEGWYWFEVIDPSLVGGPSDV